MKTYIRIIVLALCLCVFAGCEDDLEIKKDYDFTVTHLPVPKKIKNGDTVEIRCTLNRSGEYQNAHYFLRYFQYEGKGSLKMDDGTLFTANDNFPLSQQPNFKLYYTSKSNQQEEFTVTFFDTFGKEFVLTFTFNNDNEGGQFIILH